MLWVPFSSKLDWYSYIVSISKTASKKVGALIHSMKFLSPEMVLYHCKSTKRLCMEHCCHVWADDSSCHLNWLNWFHFLILDGGLLVILTDCIIFLSLFLDVARMSMPTVSFPAQLNSESL